MKIFDSFNGGSVEQQKKKKVIIYAIMLTLVLSLITVITLMTVIFVTAFKSEKDPEATGTDTGNVATATYSKYTPGNEQLKKGSLILINENNAYDFSANPDSAKVAITIPASGGTALYTKGDDVTLANSDAIKAFNNMIKKFYETNPSTEKIHMATAYKTKEQQEGGQAKAGYSDWHTGMSFQLLCADKLTGISETKFKWLYENAHTYGFVVRYPSSKEEITGYSYNYFFRFVGVAHATYMKNKNLCLEEYLELLKTDYSNSNMTESGPTKVLTVSNYDIYYCPSGTEIYVPSKNYEISGDNSSGYIITVKK